MYRIWLGKYFSIINISAAHFSFIIMADNDRNVSNGYQRATIDHLRQKSGVTVKKAPDFSTIRLQLPYLNYELFDDRGCRLMGPNLMQLLQWPSLYFPMYLSDNDTCTTFGSFMLCYKLTISRRLYASDNISYPVTLDLTTNYVKTTSKRLTVRMTERDVTEPLATATWVEVNVDLATKRPSPFPAWWKQKYGFRTDGPHCDISPAPKPRDGVAVSNRNVYVTDTDSNGHTKFSVYVTYCLDAFYMNVRQDKYKRLKRRVLSEWVRDVSVIFKGETKIGDMLTIESWEDSISKDTFHFEVSKDGSSVVLLSCRFYTELAERSKL